MEDRELKLTLKSWARNLLSVWQFLANNKLVPSSQFFWQIGGKDLFREIELAREIVQSINPNPIVYYPGIGNIGRAGLDIIYPLAVTDFSKLIGADIGPYKPDPHNYERFVQAVSLNLSLIGTIEQEEIAFQKIGDDEFRTIFPFEGRQRELHLFSNFDATLKYPTELKNGFQAFFTRRTNGLFCRNAVGSISEHLRAELMNFLTGNGLVIFQEIMGHDKNLEFKERVAERKLWLGDNFEFAPLGLKMHKSWERLMCFRKKAGN